MQKYPCLYRKGNKGYNRSSRLELFCRKGVLRNFAKFKASNFIKKQAPAQVFSCEFCEISKNIVFYRTPPVAAYCNTNLFKNIGKFATVYSFIEELASNI